jgi:hypothetical protein
VVEEKATPGAAASQNLPAAAGEQPASPTGSPLVGSLAEAAAKAADFRHRLKKNRMREGSEDPFATGSPFSEMASKQKALEERVGEMHSDVALMREQLTRLCNMLEAKGAGPGSSTAGWCNTPLIA